MFPKIKFNLHLFSALIKAIGKTREPALLILLDIYQRTRAATEEEIIQTVIPDEIRYKLFDIYTKILIFGNASLQKES